MSEVDTYIKENARMKNQSMKKFEMTTESKINIFGNKLFRIKALISFGNVKEGDTGGWFVITYEDASWDIKSIKDTDVFYPEK